MGIENLIFYLFSAVLIFSGVMVITARNPVYSVLFLILAFFNAAGLFVLLGAEFIAMILVIVYVGAVAVLFLFVVMMLDIDFAGLRAGWKTYLPVGGLVGLVLLLELMAGFIFWEYLPQASQISQAPTPQPHEIHNTQALGQLIYTHYVYLFQAAGLILLVAMIGAITLTLRQRGGVRRQVIAEQVGRKPEDVIDIVEIKSGTGIS